MTRARGHGPTRSAPATSGGASREKPDGRGGRGGGGRLRRAPVARPHVRDDGRRAASPPARRRTVPAPADRHHPRHHHRRPAVPCLALAGADGVGPRPVVHRPLGRPAALPGQRPQRRHPRPGAGSDLAVGDRILDGPPEAHCAFLVEQLEPRRHLVLHSTEHLPPGWADRYGAGIDWTWAFVLDASRRPHPVHLPQPGTAAAVVGAPPATGR